MVHLSSWPNGIDNSVVSHRTVPFLRGILALRKKFTMNPWFAGASDVEGWVPELCKDPRSRKWRCCAVFSREQCRKLSQGFLDNTRADIFRELFRTACVGCREGLRQYRKRFPQTPLPQIPEGPRQKAVVGVAEHVSKCGGRWRRWQCCALLQSEGQCTKMQQLWLPYPLSGTDEGCQDVEEHAFPVCSKVCLRGVQAFLVDNPARGPPQKMAQPEKPPAAASPAPPDGVRYVSEKPPAAASPAPPDGVRYVSEKPPASESAKEEEPRALELFGRAYRLPLPVFEALLSRVVETGFWTAGEVGR
eukprot:scaffold3371_cov189-Pinguiococcus_pyrenoidosus.AAC.1